MNFYHRVTEAQRHRGTEFMPHCGVQMVDLQRLVFGNYPIKSGRRSARGLRTEVGGLRSEVRGEAGSGINQRGSASRSVKGVISGFSTARFLDRLFGQVVAMKNSDFARRGQAVPVSGLVSWAGPRLWRGRLLRAGHLTANGRQWTRMLKRLWRGGWIVSWDEQSGRSRIFWQWGNEQKAR